MATITPDFHTPLCRYLFLILPFRPDKNKNITNTWNTSAALSASTPEKEAKMVPEQKERHSCVPLSKNYT